MTSVRIRVVGTLVVLASLLTACTGGSAVPESPGAVTPESSISSSPSISTSASPSTPSPTLPPLAPGLARGRLIVVQQAEDAALVAGAEPIRLTLARTANTAAWLAAPRQKLAGTMSTEQAMLTLGWRPADDGTTSAMNPPRPNGLLAHSGGSLAFTVRRANVRPDGTLVLDIKPIGTTPQTVQAFGPVSLTLDGVPGVLELVTSLGDLTMRIIVTGARSDQAVIQVTDASGEVLESGFVAADRPVLDGWLDVGAGDTTWSDPVVTLTPPTRGKPGTIGVTGTLTVAGQARPLDRVVARWSLPLS